jgi:hypothetical protein
MQIDFRGSIEIRDLQRAQWLQRKPRMFFAVVGVLILFSMILAGVAMLFEKTLRPWDRFWMLGFLAFLGTGLWLLPRLSVRRLWKKRSDMREPVFGRVTEGSVDFHGPVIHENALVSWEWRSDYPVFWPPFIGTFLWLMRGPGGRDWREYKRRRDEFSPMTAEDVGRARTASSNVGEKWDAFNCYKCSNRIVLLYRRNGFIWLFPRSLFKDDVDWNAFRHLARRKVPR